MTFGKPVYSRLALLGLLAVTLALAACGRKGPLDLPPSSSAEATQQVAGQPSNDPRRPQAPDKHLLIDGLLN